MFFPLRALGRLRPKPHAARRALRGVLFHASTIARTAHCLFFAGFLTICCVALSAKAEDQKTAVLFSPPQLDYAKICIVDDETDPATGKADAALSPSQKLRRARLLIRGTSAVTPDKARSAELSRSVIQSGSTGQKASAKFYLAKLLLTGSGVTRDEIMAEKLLQEAASVDPYNSMMELAALSEKQGNIPQAAEYYKKAAAAGNPKAYLVLSTYYRDNLVEAPSANASTEMIALAQNFMLQALSAGRCGALRDMANVVYNNKYRLRNDALAVEWFEAGIKAGDIYSMMMMADGYATGYRVAYNPEKAEALWQLAAQKGNSKAMFRLGKRLLLNREDKSEAISWITQAAKRGQTEATQQLIKFYRGDYGDKPQADKMVEWLQYSVAGENPPAEHLRFLADALSDGKGIEQDTVAALDLYERAAKLQDVDSLVKMGDAYKFGRGTKADAAKSYRFYRLAASEGNVEAMTALIDNYLCGVGKLTDPIKAEQWRRRALYENSREILKEETTQLLLAGDEAGHHRAIAMLARWMKKEVAYRRSLSIHRIDRTPMVLMAIAFKHGLGVQADAATSEKWLALATAKGNGQDTGYVAMAEAMLDDKKLGNNPRRAEQYLQQAEDVGNEQAAYLLGKIYELGAVGIEASPSLAKQHYLIAAEKNHPTAQRRLGAMLLRAGEVDNALPWLKKAAFQGQIGAMFLLADHAEDQGDKQAANTWLKDAANHYPCTPESRARLASLSERINGAQTGEELLAAAQKGTPIAMRKLATYYLYQGDSKNAVAWYEKAAAAGDSTAMLELGNAYYTGAGVAESMDNARQWWAQAVQAGNVEAKALLDSFSTKP
jgi:TPR repeat protein